MEETYTSVAREVVERLVVKRDKRLGHESIKPLLLVLGGSMRGPYGAGAIHALFDFGLGKVFETVVGISTGAAIGAYFLAGSEEQIRLGSSLYFEECTTSLFFNPWRWRKKVDIDWLIEGIKHGPKRLDVAAIQKNPTQFFVAAITRRGRQELIDAKTASPDILTAIRASMAVPGFYGQWVTVNGQQYCDGGFNDPFPLGNVIDRFHPTDILIIPNQSYDVAVGYRPSLSDAIAALMALPQLGALKAGEIFRRKMKFRKVMESLPSIKSARISVLWPPALGLHEASRNSTMLRSAYKQSRMTASKFLHGA
ncbi:MAG: patatin-like phospholipase family protein [Candidatus Kerfeldbacteria bacterium]|nr:patatin-like phospholipase family protein [Candidatus Kerfeldbacteria bacterium]